MEAGQLDASAAAPAPASAPSVASSRLARVRAAAAARGVPLAAILITAGVVVLTYLAGKLIYRLRDVILLMVAGGFMTRRGATAGPATWRAAFT